MYVGTIYEEEWRIREKRKKEGSLLYGHCYCNRPNFNSDFGGAKVEISKSCLWTRCSTLEYVARNYTKTEVRKWESGISLPCLWTMPKNAESWQDHVIQNTAQFVNIGPENPRYHTELLLWSVKTHHCKNRWAKRLLCYSYIINEELDFSGKALRKFSFCKCLLLTFNYKLHVPKQSNFSLLGFIPNKVGNPNWCETTTHLVLFVAVVEFDGCLSKRQKERSLVLLWCQGFVFSTCVCGDTSIRAP